MDDKFLPAQAAILCDNAKELERLVRETPALATERSKCDHPTLLCCLVLEMPPRRSLAPLIRLFAELGAELGGPLGAAASIDNAIAAETLLDLGAPIAGDGPWSPLDEALYWGNKTTVELLIRRGASLDNLRKRAALGDVPGVRQCFGANGSLNDSAGELAWPFGAMPNEARHDRRQIVNNALVFAAAWGQIDAAAELLARGAEINSLPAGFDFVGTPLHYAALNNRREMADWLLERGADPTIRDPKVQHTPDGWAEYAKHPELAEHLRERRG